MKRLLLAATIMSIATSHVLADTITHFGDGPLGDVATLLDDAGIGSASVGTETTATSFLVPGPVATMTDLTFTFERDTGGFLAEFGYYPISSVVGIDPISDKAAYGGAALGSKVIVFDDSTDNPGATSSHTVAAGDELGFYLIPNGGSGGASAADLVPLFSNSDANPGEFDQLLSFVGSGITLFTWEDLRRDGGSSAASDEDFTDLAFTIDAELGTPTSVPEGGSTSLLLGLAILGLHAVKKRD